MATKTKPATKTNELAEALRDAVERSGRSCYALSAETGVAASVLSRFMAGERDLKLETASRLIVALGLELRRKR